MAAYIIVDVEILDRAKYDEYVKVVPQTIASYGGKFLVRGGAAETLEGAWRPNRVVVLQFDTVERAKQWWASEEYGAPKRLRQSASRADMIVVEGV
jgi:uncharacterized protein (DUF1330 family)